MQHPHQELKPSSLVTPYRLDRWLSLDHADRAVDIHQVQLDYQRQIIRLMVAQTIVLYGSSAIHFLPADCQASFKCIPASKALSLAGLLTQLAFYFGIPSHIEALSRMTTEQHRSRGVLFLVWLWLPFMPFVLSIVLLFFGSNIGACIPVSF